MRFNRVNPRTNQVETVEHIPYRVVAEGGTFVAYRVQGKHKGKILARSYISEERLRINCDSMTQPVEE